jgi:hypothetical protein
MYYFTIQSRKSYQIKLIGGQVKKKSMRISDFLPLEKFVHWESDSDFLIQAQSYIKPNQPNFTKANKIVREFIDKLYQKKQHKYNYWMINEYATGK